MYYGKIKNVDIANGLGVRVTLFVSGCRRHCKGCFNPETWDFEYGEEYTLDVEDKILGLLSPDYVDGLTVMGGEPFEPENRGQVLALMRRVKHELPQKDIWVYTGNTYEELENEKSPDIRGILDIADMLVDGAFIEEKRNLNLDFRGSENQRIIDLLKTREKGKVNLYVVDD